MTKQEQFRRALRQVEIDAKAARERYERLAEAARNVGIQTGNMRRQLIVKAHEQPDLETDL